MISKKVFICHLKFNCPNWSPKQPSLHMHFLYIRGGYPAYWECLPVRVFLDSFKLASSCLPVSWHLPFDIPVNLHSLGRRFMMNVGDVNHLSRLASLSLWICTPWGALSVLKFCSSCAGFSGKVWTLRSLEWRSSVLPSLLKR